MGGQTGDDALAALRQSCKDRLRTIGQMDGPRVAVLGIGQHPTAAAVG
jgi:hypothetical protein